MKCEQCGAEMIPGFGSMTFYCPNECDLKPDKNPEEPKDDGGPFVTHAGNIRSTQTSPVQLWFYLDCYGCTTLFTPDHITKIEIAIACIGWQLKDVAKVEGKSDAYGSIIFITAHDFQGTVMSTQIYA